MVSSGASWNTSSDHSHIRGCTHTDSIGKLDWKKKCTSSKRSKPWAGEPYLWSVNDGQEISAKTAKFLTEGLVLIKLILNLLGKKNKTEVDKMRVSYHPVSTNKLQISGDKERGVSIHHWHEPTQYEPTQYICKWYRSWEKKDLYKPEKKLFNWYIEWHLRLKNKTKRQNSKIYSRTL